MRGVFLGVRGSLATTKSGGSVLVDLQARAVIVTTSLSLSGCSTDGGGRLQAFRACEICPFRKC